MGQEHVRDLIKSRRLLPFLLILCVTSIRKSGIAICVLEIKHIFLKFRCRWLEGGIFLNSLNPLFTLAIGISLEVKCFGPSNDLKSSGALRFLHNQYASSRLGFILQIQNLCDALPLSAEFKERPHVHGFILFLKVEVILVVVHLEQGAPLQ